MISLWPNRKNTGSREGVVMVSHSQVNVSILDRGLGRTLLVVLPPEPFANVSSVGGPWWPVCHT